MRMVSPTVNTAGTTYRLTDYPLWIVSKCISLDSHPLECHELILGMQEEGVETNCSQLSGFIQLLVTTFDWHDLRVDL